MDETRIDANRRLIDVAIAYLGSHHLVRTLGYLAFIGISGFNSKLTSSLPSRVASTRIIRLDLQGSCTMWSAYMHAVLGLLVYTSIVASAPSATIPDVDVTYRDIDCNGVEAFVNIPYGMPTDGAHRFKSHRLHIPVPGSTIYADSYGPACPQDLGGWISPLSLTNVTWISEDCLNLNIVRLKRDKAKCIPPCHNIHPPWRLLGWSKQ